jgi:rod shape determining protein RodA
MPVIVLALAVAPAFLIVKEPDLSTALVFMIIVCSLLFAGGLDYKIIFGAIAVMIPCAALLIFMILQPDQTLLNTYQQSRILAWIHPEEYASTTAYQTIKSMTAIGSGRLMGKGYNTTTISSLLNTGFISQAQTDFIYAVIGEEFGFIGCSLVALLLLGICVRCFSIASRARNLRGRILASGIGAWIGFQGFINIFVTIGLLPNTGIPLPFVSYGLTSLVCLFAGIGCVLSVGMRG